MTRFKFIYIVGRKSYEEIIPAPTKSRAVVSFFKDSNINKIKNLTIITL